METKNSAAPEMVFYKKNEIKSDREKCAKKTGYIKMEVNNKCFNEKIMKIKIKS